MKIHIFFIHVTKMFHFSLSLFMLNHIIYKTYIFLTGVPHSPYWMSIYNFSFRKIKKKRGTFNKLWESI